MAGNTQTVVDNNSNGQSIVTYDFEGTKITYDTIFDEVEYEDNEDTESLYEPNI